MKTPEGTNMLSSEDLLSKVTLTRGGGKGGTINQSYGLLLLMLPPLHQHGDGSNICPDWQVIRKMHPFLSLVWNIYNCVFTAESFTSGICINRGLISAKHSFYFPRFHSPAPHISPLSVWMLYSFSQQIMERVQEQPILKWPPSSLPLSHHPFFTSLLEYFSRSPLLAPHVASLFWIRWAAELGPSVS